MDKLFKKRMERMQARIESLEDAIRRIESFVGSINRNVTDMEDDLVVALKAIAKDKVQKDAKTAKDKLMEKADDKGYYHAYHGTHSIDPRDVTIRAISDGKVNTISTSDDDDIKQAYVRGHRRGSRHKKRYRMVNSKGF